MTGIIVMIIVVAIVTVFATRPGADVTINRLGSFMASSIKALLGG